MSETLQFEPAEVLVADQAYESKAGSYEFEDPELDDAELTGLVSQHADLIVPVPWLGGTDMPLGEAMWHIPITRESIQEVTSLVRQMIAEATLPSETFIDDQESDTVPEATLATAQNPVEIEPLFTPSIKKDSTIVAEAKQPAPTPAIAEHSETLVTIEARGTADVQDVDSVAGIEDSDKLEPLAEQHYVKKPEPAVNLMSGPSVLSKDLPVLTAINTPAVTQGVKALVESQPVATSVVPDRNYLSLDVPSNAPEYVEALPQLQSPAGNAPVLDAPVRSSEHLVSARAELTTELPEVGQETHSEPSVLVNQTPQVIEQHDDGLASAASIEEEVTESEHDGVDDQAPEGEQFIDDDTFLVETEEIAILVQKIIEVAESNDDKILQFPEHPDEIHVLEAQLDELYDALLEAYPPEIAETLVRQIVYRYFVNNPQRIKKETDEDELAHTRQVVTKKINPVVGLSMKAATVFDLGRAALQPYGPFHWLG